jgi:glycosyltransferase involved in cell wall biosynthesis
MQHRPAALWVDWDRHLRSRTLARRLDVTLLEVRIGGNRIWRYLKSIRRTMSALRGARPSIVIATNPSIVLGLLLLGVRRWFGFALVSDAHYVGIRSLRGQRLMQRVLDFYNSRADLVIVTNERQAQYLASIGGRPFLCPDPLPDLSDRIGARVAVPEKSVFLICSFERDEPYEAAFDAFSQLQQSGYTLFVSGNYRRASVDPARFPWVRFLGYVSEPDYYSYLVSCAVTMDLTLLEDCLLCGAYEALAARRPLVISNTQALRDYFGTAAVLTNNTPEAIAASVERAYAQRSALTQEATKWVIANEVYMGERITTLRVQLGALQTRSVPTRARRLRT